jgi:hypothetical protein
MIRTKTIRLNFNLRLCFRSDVKFNFRVTIEIENLRAAIDELRLWLNQIQRVNCDYASDQIVWNSISELQLRLYEMRLRTLCRLRLRVNQLRVRNSILGSCEMRFGRESVIAIEMRKCRENEINIVWDWDEKVQRKWDLGEKGLRRVLPS